MNSTIHCDALSALKLLQESGDDVPFIIVSGNIGEDVAVKALKMGAQGYLTKPIDLALLSHELQGIGLAKEKAA